MERNLRTHPRTTYDFANELAMTGYILTAVTANGQCLLEKWVRSAANLDDKNFFGGGMPAPGLSYGNDDLSFHTITKQEARDLIESQFPGQAYEGPIAVSLNLEKFRFSFACTFWYFTVGGSEYIIDSRINQYNYIPGGVTNHAMIRGERYGSPYLYCERMARLDSPRADFFAKIRSSGSATFNIPNSPAPVFSFTPIVIH